MSLHFGFKKNRQRITYFTDFASYVVFRGGWENKYFLCHNRKLLLGGSLLSLDSHK